MEEAREEGLRFNSGKPRYDLIHPVAERGLVNILTFGTEKYAEWDWAKGMSYMETIASLRRHMTAFIAGEDIDPESGLPHVDHMQANCHFLSAFFNTKTGKDDRLCHILNNGHDYWSTVVSSKQNE